MNINISNSIYLLRTRENMTQEQLAVQLNVTSSAISSWESGISLPSIESLCYIADYFNVSVDVILGRLKEETKADKNRENNNSYLLIKDILMLAEKCQMHGLLSMNYDSKYNNEFLKFSIEFVLEACQSQMSPNQIFEILINYANSDNKESLNNKIIANGLICILAGESRKYTEELLLSFLGFNFRRHLDIKNISSEDSLQKLTEKYYDKKTYSSNTKLIESIYDIDNDIIKNILQNVNNKTLIDALKGASGTVVIKLLSNIDKDLILYIDEDISKWDGNENEIIEAQYHILNLINGIDVDQ